MNWVRLFLLKLFLEALRWIGAPVYTPSVILGPIPNGGHSQLWFVGIVVCVAPFFYIVPSATEKMQMARVNQDSALALQAFFMVFLSWTAIWAIGRRAEWHARRAIPQD